MTTVIQTQSTNVNTASVYKGSRWSHSGTYLAMGGASGVLYIFKRNGNALTLLSSPLIGTAPAGNVYDVDWSKDDKYIAVYYSTLSGSSFTAIYKNNGNDTWTRITTPATTIAPGSRALDAVSFSYNGNPLVAYAMNTTPFLEIQKYDDTTDTFTKCTLAGDAPTGAASGVRFSPDGNYLVVNYASTTVLYRVGVSGTTVTLTACTQTSGTAPTSSINAAWHPSSQYFAVFQNIGTAPLFVYKITGTTTFAQLPASLPGLYSFTSNSNGDWSSDGRRLMGRDGSANIYVWEFHSDETFTLDVSYPGVASGSAQNRVRFSPDGGTMTISAGDTTGTTFAQFYSAINPHGVAPATPAISGQQSVAGQRAWWSKDGQYLYISIRSASPGFYIYKRTGNTFTRVASGNIAGGTTWSDGRPGDHSRDNKYVGFASQSTARAIVLKNNGDDTFTSVLSATLASNPSNVSFSPTQDVFAVSVASSPFVVFYKYDPASDTFTPLTLAGTTTALEAAPNMVKFSPNGNFLLVSYNTTAAYRLYQVTFDLTANTATLTPVAKPGSGEPAQISDWGDFDPSGTYFAVFTRTGSAAPFVYKISGSTYSKLAGQPTAPRGSGNYYVHGSFKTDGKRLFALSNENSARLYSWDFISEVFTTDLTTDYPALGSPGESAVADPANKFIAITTGSSPYLTLWTNGWTAVAVAQVPAIGARTVLKNNTNLAVRTSLGAIGAKTVLNNYTLEYPAAIPYEEVPPDIYLDAFQPPWTEEEINGAAIGTDYGKQIAEIELQLTFSVTIDSDYGKQEAFLLEAYPITIDVTYGAQDVDIEADILADYVNISYDYGAQQTDISEIVVPNATINYDYGAQEFDMLVGMDAAPVILSDYGKQLTEIETSAPIFISYDYGKQLVDVEVDDPIGVLIAETYGKQVIEIDASVPDNVNINYDYGKQTSSMSVLQEGVTITETYGKQTADIVADIGKFIDMNYAYGKQEATINVGVSGRGRITFMLIQP